MTIKRFFSVFSVLCALSVSLAFSQSMHWNVSSIQSAQKSESSANSQKAAPKASAAMRVGPAETFKELAESVGTDISNPFTAMKHAEFHIYAMGAAPLKVGLNAKQDAIKSLGVLGSGDSPLVGNREYISRIYGALVSQKGFLKDRMFALTLVSNANFGLVPTASALLYGEPNLGSYCLRFLKNVATNPKNDFYTRRLAVSLIASFRRTESARALGDVLKSVSKEPDDWSFGSPSTWVGEPIYDVSMAFDKSGRLFENYDGTEQTAKGALIVSIISALDSLIDSPAREGALKMMRYFSGLAKADSHNTIYQKISDDYYKSMGGRHIAYLASLYMLARRGLVHSNIQQHPRNPNNYYETNPEGMRVVAVIHDAFYGSLHQDYLCDTRTAFYNTYRNMTQYWNGWRGMVSSSGAKISYPANYSERECKSEHFAKAATFEIGKFLIFNSIGEWSTVAKCLDQITNVVKCSRSVSKLKGNSDFVNIYNAVSDCSSLTQYSAFANTLDAGGRINNVANTR